MYALAAVVTVLGLLALVVCAYVIWSQLHPRDPRTVVRTSHGRRLRVEPMELSERDQAAQSVALTEGCSLAEAYDRVDASTRDGLL